MPEQETDAIETAITGDSKSIIKAALQKIANKQIRVDRYERYYRGNHPMNFGSEKFTTEFAARLQHFRDNLCPTCVQAPADRLEVTGFASDKESELYKTTWDIWKYSKMPRWAKLIHRDAFKTGDGFLVVWADETGRARLYRQDPSTCAVFYDLETGNVEIGVKVWKGNDRRIYLTLYYADRLEKYVSRNPAAGSMPTTAAAVVPRSENGEDAVIENPIGVNPMFHFGREASILEDVIPLNDALNKSIADMLISSEGNSMMKRWVTGIAYEVNPENGKQIIPFDNLAAWFATQDPTAKFGSFPEIDLKNFLETVKDFRLEIAAVAGIPPYYFRLPQTGTLPSGEALRKAEARFTSLIKDAQLDFGETWAAAIQFAVAIDGKADSVDNSEGAQIETKWRPADALSESELVDLAIKKKSVGVSKSKALSEIGYTDDEIKTMAEENAADNAANAAQFSKVFDAGPTVAG